MKQKRLFILTSIVFLGVALSSCGSKTETPVEETPDGYVDVLPANNDGNILQAFCWTFKQIKQNIPAIAEAGFKVVQTSPVQEPKSGGPTWWSYYQPLSFTIAQDSGLGTKKDLIDLCDEAEKYGVKVICDIVFNHLANISDDDLETDGTPMVSPEVAKYEPYIYEHRNDSGDSATFHHNPKATGSGAVTQVYSFGKLPDLNTANPYVQERSLALLKECIDAGVDGFRFDAAKHIETPNDPQYASDFWPNVLGEAKEYYKEKTNEELIAYGEILNDVDGNRKIEDYTEFMKVTENTYINDIAAGSIAKNATKALNASYGKKTDAKDLVTWVESHDTYVDASSHISDRKAIRQYAIISSRKDTVSMFLARPDSNAQVGTVASYAFEDLSVGAINRFHNRFVGFDEEQSANGAIYVNERFKDDVAGAVVVNFEGAGEAEVKFSHLGTGVYYDQVSGQSITIKDNVAKLTFESNGLFILTKSKNLARPQVDASNKEATFGGLLSISLTVVNATESTYSINGGTKKAFTNDTIITIGDVFDENRQITLVVEASNEQFSTKRTYHYSVVDVIEGYFNVVNIKHSYLENYDLYYWQWNNNKQSIWSNDYTVQNGVVLIDFRGSSYTSFLLAIFPKDYTIKKMDEWDQGVIKQTRDIAVSEQIFDASSF